ncbi:MAG TPA: twin-arginine translocase subunit TatC [Microthrixaceae bacterium]|nr:twin-arginine translocase subunit TatC [Microthrixaceae bacterium]
MAVLKGAEREGASMALGDHLRELRRRLLICVGTVAVMLIPAWFLYPWMIDILNAPYCDALTNLDPDASCKFLETNLLDPFTLRLRIAGYGALFLAMPVILWQLWRFIAPGLYKKERRYALVFTVSATVLFVAGAVTAYLTLTQAVNFLVSIGGPDVEIRSGIGNFVKLALFMMLAFGVGFQFPVVVVALQMIGVVTPERLSSWRRQAIVLITIIAAGITPSGDPISMFALAIPMYLFFEISIVIGRLWNRRKRKAASREAEAEKERRAARAARRAEAATTEPDTTEPDTTEPDTTDGDGS